MVDKGAIFGAHRSTTTAIVVSGIRCIFAYLLIPIVAPSFGLLNVLNAPIGILLSLFAVWMGIAGVRRFWIADHRARWSYTAFIAVVLVMLSVSIVIDLASLI